MGVGFVDGQDLGPLLFALDDPEVKDFGGDQALVLIAQLFCKIVQLISGITGDNAVHQGRAEVVVLLHPAQELLAELPLPGVLQNDTLKVGAVVVNQLHRQEQQATVVGASKGLEALIQESTDLGRKGVGGTVFQLVTGVIGNAGLGGVGDNDL